MAGQAVLPLGHTLADTWVGGVSLGTLGWDGACGKSPWENHRASPALGSGGLQPSEKQFWGNTGPQPSRCSAWNRVSWVCWMHRLMKSDGPGRSPSSDGKAASRPEPAQADGTRKWLLREDVRRQSLCPACTFGHL